MKKSPNEANFRDDVCIAQHEVAIGVPANSGGSSGLDNLQTKPIFLETKPVSADGSGALDDRTDRSDGTDRTDSVADAQREREALEARRWQRFVQMQAARWGGARGQPAMFDSGAANGGEASAAAGGAVVSPDARGP